MVNKLDRINDNGTEEVNITFQFDGPEPTAEEIQETLEEIENLPVTRGKE